MPYIFQDNLIEYLANYFYINNSNFINYNSDQNSNSTDFIYSEYAFSHLYLGTDTPLMVTGGLTIGVLF